MAENRRTQTASAIKRASIKARNNANRLDKKALDELTGLYKKSSSDLRDIVKSYEGSDGSVKLEVLNDLLAQTNTRLEQLQTARDTLLDDSMFDAATLGVAPFIGGQVSNSLVSTQVAHDAVLHLRNFIAEDGLQLSDRLWRIDNHAKQVVADSIQSAIIQGHSATQAALDLVSTGQAIPRDLAAKIITANGDSIGSNIIHQLMRQEGSPYDNALRLFRTEINRAHGNAYQASVFDHPDTIGTRFLLSPNHPRRDICDLHASVNRYGLGAGVYPEGRNPWPAHPNTLSYVEAVFRDEVTDEDRAGKVNRIGWLEQQSVSRQNAILGKHKGWMLRQGWLRENAINTPWKILKKRLEKAGVDIPSVADIVPPLPLNSSVSVIDVIEANTHFKQVDTALAAIDSVHSVRGLPRIGVNRDQSRKTHGRYMHDGEIRISSLADHPELTLAHEVGHFIDHRGFFGAGMSSEESIALAQWRKAVNQSPEIKNLRDIASGKMNGHYNKLNVAYKEDYVEYLLKTREVWARSYAQWIATKSGDKIMNNQLSDMIKLQQNAVIEYTSQWDQDNFKPISDAIDDVFSKSGWLK